MRRTRILEPLPAEEKTPEVKQTYKRIAAKLRQVSSSRTAIITLSFDQLLGELAISEDEYIKAVRSSIGMAKVSLILLLYLLLLKIFTLSLLIT